MNQDVMKDFFAALGTRLTNENRLSDVTYAMCVCSKSFSKFFLEFVFPKDLYIPAGGRWEREYVSQTDPNSRIDFLYEKDNQKFVIENKINDGDTHIAKYLEAFEDCERAFIANYEYKDDSKCYSKCSTWKSFINELKEQNITADDWDENLIKYYCNYVSNVICLLEAKKMNLTNITGIKSFFITSTEVAHQNDLENYNNCQDTKLDYSDISFLGKMYHNKSNNVFYTFALDFSFEEAKIQIWLKIFKYADDKARIADKNHKAYKDYMKSLLKKIQNNNQNNNQSKIIEIVDISGEDDELIEDIGIGFELNNKYAKYFFDENSTLEQQKQCLEEFLLEVIKVVEKTEEK